MSEGKRPGGLTALAVINFVFAGLGALGALGLVAIVAIVAIAGDPDADVPDGLREVAKIWNELGVGLLYAMLAFQIVMTGLLLVSGIGYLQQKKFLGRTLGNVYGVVAIASGLIMALVVSNPEIGGGFNVGTIIGLIYPVLTLILLNGTFKHDFVR